MHDDVRWSCWAVLGSAILTCFLPVSSCAYEIPRDNTRAEYLYVFGPQGNAYLGAEDVDHEQVVYVNVPEKAFGDVFIEVYDPDTGGSRDLKPTSESAWDTTVQFSVYGQSQTPLASKTFGESAEYDRTFYTFGPFNKEDGRKIQGGYQFQVVAKALEGTNQNLFKLKIFPENAQTFSDKISFRLLPKEGEKMFFFVEIPAGVTKIVAENYDLDPDGGAAELKDPLTGEVHKLIESKSARWASTAINLTYSDQPRRVMYIITKKVQKYANAAIRVKDDKGNVLALYYAMDRNAAAAGAPPHAAAPVPAAAESVQVPDLQCNKFTFDATGSYDPNKEKISYLWDFGDGTTSTDPVVTHVYEKGGVYRVTLQVKDESGLECDTSISAQEVKVNAPPQAAFTGPETTCAGSAVTFDAGATTDDSPETLTYTWDFGDGTNGEGKTVSKTYDKGGTYQVRLLVDDKAGTPCSNDTVTKQIYVNSPPVADAGDDIDICFSTSQELKVNVDGGKSNDPDADAMTYDWDFGDGTSASGRSVTHIYKAPGEYTARLVVNDGRNAPCSTSEDSVKVRLNRSPIADIGGGMTSCVGTAVTLDGSKSQGENLKYTWDFGDGQTGSGATVTHSYAKGGNYRVMLTVDDGKGTRCSTDAATANVFVNAGPQLSLGRIDAVCQGAVIRCEADAKDPDGNPLSYTWNFGDGTVVEGGASQSHAYARGGEYTVTVSVDDKQGTACSLNSAATSVRVNSRPSADAGPNLVCCVDKEAVFDGSGSSDPDGDTLTYRWNFGDGATAEGARVTHSYAASGRYTVSLTVDDNSGTACSSSAASFEANVNAKPVSVIKVK